jgi:thioredoxin 1
MASSNVKILNDHNFNSEVLHADLPVLVFFTMADEFICAKQEPIIDAIADDYKGRVKVGMLDVDQARDTAQKYNIHTLPAHFAFKDGVKTGQLFGRESRERLLALLGL